MPYSNILIFFASFLLFCPISVLILGLLPESRLDKNPYYFSVLASKMAFLGFISAMISGIFLFNHGPLVYKLGAGNFQFDVLYFDNLSLVVLLLISFLLFMVLRFSFNYLKGDKNQGRFTKWLCLTGGSVIFLVISGNLIQFSVAWVSTSLCLHQLLQFYPERPGALLAARKKFIISRIGDACLLMVLILVFREFHTLNYESLFAAVRNFNGLSADVFIHHLNPICLLLVAGAMLKSAQFPFHSWLPDTMETPTPVSALMHAGIINAGGFLIIRMAPLVITSHAAMATLAFFGAITALLGSLVMLTHSSIKRVLAFSTIAQMGFMMLECGLGAFSLALLHLVSHSLYKAYAFLSSGTVKISGKSFLGPSKRSLNPIAILISLILSFGIVWGFSYFLKIEVFNTPPNRVLAIFFSLSMSYFLWNLWSQKWTPLYFIYGIIGGFGIGFGYFILHKVFQEYILTSLPYSFQSYSLPEYFLMGFLVLIFVLVMVLQMELPKKNQSPFLGALYVHARNGFYFNTLFNRWVQSLWPVQKK